VATVTPTALPVEAQMDNDNRFVRKHGTQILAIADYSTPMPTSWFRDVFAEDGTTVLGQVPSVLPLGFKNLGFISTDGIQESTDVSSSTVNAAQELEPIRSDIDGIEGTLQVSLLEMSSWVKALAYNYPVSAWPAEKGAAWEFHRGAVSEFPYYRLLVLTQDGVGLDAVYRVEAAYRAKVTDIGDRTLNRTDAEMLQRTFTLYKDREVNRSKTEAQTAVRGA
jgi:hypothetical protein